VELVEGEDLQRAATGLNGQALQNRTLAINEARPSARATRDSATAAVGAGHTAGETTRRRWTMKLKTGQYVRHSRYGWGTIMEDDGKR